MPGSGGSAGSGSGHGDAQGAVRVLDTNTLVYYLEGEAVVVQRLDAIRAAHETLSISAIVEVELLSYARLTRADRARIESFLAILVSVPLDSSVARVAAAFRRQYRLKLADAVISATAFLRDAPLITRNVRDFAKVKEITVERI